MSKLRDQIIDQLMDERKRAGAQGMAQKESDALLLLALLLEDAKQNPQNYARRS